MPQDLQDRAVDAEIAELVDDEREPPPARVFERVADQRGFAGAEKAGDYGDGNLRGDHAVRSGGQGRNAGEHTAPHDFGPLAPRGHALGMRRIGSREGDDVRRVQLRIEVRDDIGPFAGRGQRDGAAALAAGEAFGGRKLDSAGTSGFHRFREREPHPMAGSPFLRLQRLLPAPARDADVEGRGRAYAILHGGGGTACRGSERRVRCAWDLHE